jgi:hypothetical protein
VSVPWRGRETGNVRYLLPATALRGRERRTAWTALFTNLMKSTRQPKCRTPRNAWTPGWRMQIAYAVAVIGLGGYAAVEAAIDASPGHGDSANMPALRKQRGRRKMEYFAGLDVSLAETSVCVVDEKGTVIMASSVATEPTYSLHQQHTDFTAAVLIEHARSTHSCVFLRPFALQPLPRCGPMRQGCGGLAMKRGHCWSCFLELLGTRGIL